MRSYMKLIFAVSCFSCVWDGHFAFASSTVSEMPLEQVTDDRQPIAKPMNYQEGIDCLRKYLKPEYFIRETLFDQAEKVVLELTELFRNKDIIDEYKASGKTTKDVVFEEGKKAIFGALSDERYVSRVGLYTLAERAYDSHMILGEESRSVSSTLYCVGILAAAGIKGGLSILSGQLRLYGYDEAKERGIPAEKVTKLADRAFSLSRNNEISYKTYSKEVMPAVAAKFTELFGPSLFPKPIENDKDKKEGKE